MPVPTPALASDLVPSPTTASVHFHTPTPVPNPTPTFAQNHKFSYSGS